MASELAAVSATRNGNWPVYGMLQNRVPKLKVTVAKNSAEEIPQAWLGPVDHSWAQRTFR